MRAPGSYAGLTAMQAELLSYLRSRENGGQITPSYDEMSVAVGLATKSGIHRLIVALQARGYITRIPGASRSIQCTHRPATATEPAALGKSRLSQFTVGQLIGELETRGMKVMAA
jgi:repressor LexA